MNRRASSFRSLTEPLGYFAVLALFVPAMLVRFHLCCVVPAMCGGPDDAGEHDAVPTTSADAGTPAPESGRRSCCTPSPTVPNPVTPARSPATTVADAPPVAPMHGSNCGCRLNLCRQNAAGFTAPSLAPALTTMVERAPLCGLYVPASVPGLAAAPELHVTLGMRRSRPSALVGTALGGGDFTIPLRS